MEFIGTDATAAPRLAQERDRRALADYFAQIVDIIANSQGLVVVHVSVS